MWNERYGKPGYAYGTEPNDFLVSVAPDIPNGKVLCIGEGEGRNAVYLASLGHEVVAVDQSDVGLAKAQKLAAARGVTIQTIVANLADFIIEPAGWQAVVSIFCHLPTELWTRVNKAAIAGLAPGGVFVMESYTPDQLQFNTGGPREVDRLVSLQKAKTTLTGVRWMIAREIERTVNEGEYHHGRAAVVQLFGTV